MVRLSRPAKTITSKQGQYLAFIHLSMRLHRRSPAETDMQQYFRVSPPSVHQMVLTSNAWASSKDSQERPAASNCSLIPNSSPTYLHRHSTGKTTVQRYWSN
jgi:hypothetical protein